MRNFRYYLDMSDSRVIIVSNRLPVRIVEKEGHMTLERSIGGLATALRSVFDQGGALWLGWPGTHQALTKQQLHDLDFPERFIHIPISERLLHRYYDRLSNGALWPIMHGLEPEKGIEAADWKALREVSRRFASAIQAHSNPEDVIWVHDYHLILLPQLLREAGVHNRIGFFLHTPFPPEKSFLAWPEHRQLLQSLSQVDVLGFQTARDTANFRINLAATGMKMKPGAIIRDYPIGVDYKAYRAASKRAKVKSYIRRLSKKVAGKRTIVSVSRLDYTKGILQQLDAVSDLLENHKHPEKILYKLIVAPSRENVAAYRRLKQDIEETVAAVNARFARNGFRPIDFEYRNFGFEEINAWYRLADVLLVTPRIDGMNLVVKEYIAARETNRGMVVMSDTIGAAAQLKDAILIDPLNPEAITGGLWKALNMPMLERRKRWQKLRENVRKENVFWWADQFLLSLRTKPDKSH